MRLYNKHARVLIEVEMESGDRLQFPVEGAHHVGDGLNSWHELRIPLSSGFLTRVLEGLDDYEFRTGRS